MSDHNLLNCHDMDKLIERVQYEYGISIIDAESIDNKSFTAHTEEGDCVVENTRNKEIHLIFINGIYDYVIGRGFKNCIKIYPLKSGKSYFSALGNLYVVYGYMGNTQRFSYKENCSDMIRVLGDFHKCAEGYIPPAGGKATSSWGKWIDKYRKKARLLKRYRDCTKLKKEKSIFDNMFLKSCDEYIDRIDHASTVLRKSDYLGSVEDSMRRHQICLCDLRTSNFLRSKQDIYIKSFAKCSYDIVETDLAELFKEFIKVWQAGVHMEPSMYIDMYNNINPLRGNSLDLINALVVFPGEYEKVCSRYYREKKKYSEETYVRKLTAAMAYESKKIEFLKSLV